MPIDPNYSPTCRSASSRPAHRRRLVAAAMGLLIAATVHAQQLSQGLALENALVPSSALAAADSTHGTWYFDGNQLTARNQAGVTRLVLQLPYWTWGTFLIDLGNDTMLLGEGEGGLWLATPTGLQQPVPLARIPLHYDATAFDAHTVLVSARTGGWSAADNDLLAVDLDTGDVQQLAVVPGASGPLTIGPSGDLFYATASAVYPTPPGSLQILRFARATVLAALASHTVLTPQHATVSFRGLDAAADIEFDDDGDLFFTDFVHRTVGEIHDLEGSAPSLRAPLLDYGATLLSPGTLQFVASPAAAAGDFEPMQPSGGRMLVFATDYFSIGELHRIRARRPDLTAAPAGAIATGPFSLHLSEGPANALALLLLAPGSSLGEHAIALPPFEQPLWLDLTVTASIPVAVVLLDALGVATLPLHNPGFAAINPITAQCVCLAPSGAIGSSIATTLLLSN